MGAMDEMMEAFIGSMSKEDKQDMMSKMMEKFFGDMTAEDKQKMMEQMMPKMMEGINMMEMMPRMMMSMMSGMTGGSQGTGMPAMMPHMMTQMMPHCMNIMVPGIPKDERVEFILNMITSLMEQGTAGMSEEEKNEFVAKVMERVTR
jgi:hypothetical protein